MGDHKDFFEQAKHQIDKLGNELDELDHKVKTECRNANDWYIEQMRKLRSEWQETSAEFEKLSTRAQSEGQAAYDKAKADAERHWSALQAAVKTYRTEVERNTTAG